MGKTSTENTIDLSYGTDQEDSESNDIHYSERSKIQSVKYIPVRCSFTESRDVIFVHHSGGDIKLRLTDFMDKTDIRKFRNNYEEGSVCYIICFRMKTGESVFNHIYQLTASKNGARKAKRDIRSVADIYNRLFYSRDNQNEDVIEFGLRQRLNMENILVSKLLDISQILSKVYVVVMMISAYSIIFFFGGMLAKYLSVSLAITSLVIFSVHKWIDLHTFKSVRTDDDSILERNFNTRKKVVIVEIQDKEDEKVVVCKDLDLEWTFSKNDFGEVCGHERKIIQNFNYLQSKDKAIVRVCRNLTGVEGLESNSGDYVMPEFEDKDKWIM